MLLLDFLAIFPEFFLVFSISFLIIFNVIIWPLAITPNSLVGSFFEKICVKRHNYRMLGDGESAKFLYSGLEAKKDFLNLHFVDRLSEQKFSLQNVQNIFVRTVWLAILILFITLCLCLNFDSFFYNNFFYLDNYILDVKILVLILSIFFMFILSNSSSGPFLFESIVLILICLLGLFCLISSYDLLFFYLSLELQSFCLYLLACLKRNSEYSVEAGLKYFVLGAFASGLILFGCSFIYGFSGTTNFGSLQIFFSNLFLDSFSFFDLAGFYLGFLFVFVGLFFKLSAFPFHMWVPDVYEGSPLYITCFFSVIPKFVLFSFFLKFFFIICFGFGCELEMASFFFFGQPLLLFCSLGSMIIGTVGGLFQRKIKRLFAYSAISHIGYLLLGCAAGTLEGFQAVFIYLFFYAAVVLGVFTILLSLKLFKFSKLSGGLLAVKKNSIKNPVYFSDLFYVFRSNRLLGLIFVIFIFSMAGIPPLGGFYGKFYVFLVSFNSQLYFLTFVAVFTSVVGCFYYLRIIKLIFFTTGPAYRLQQNHFLAPISFVSSVLILTILIILISFVFYPGPVLYFTYSLVLELVC